MLYKMIGISFFQHGSGELLCRILCLIYRGWIGCFPEVIIEKDDVPFFAHHLFGCYNGTMSFLLQYSLCHNGFGNLHKSGNIGSLHVVHIPVGSLAIFHAVLVNVLHDGMQSVVHLFSRP